MKDTLLEKIDLFLLSEGKVSVSPYLKSVLKKQSAFKDGEIDKIINGLKNADASISIAIGTPYTKGQKYILLDGNDDVVISKVEKDIKDMGFVVTNTKKDGGKTYIYFK